MFNVIIVIIGFILDSVRCYIRHRSFFHRTRPIRSNHQSWSNWNFYWKLTEAVNILQNIHSLADYVLLSSLIKNRVSLILYLILICNPIHPKCSDNLWSGVYILPGLLILFPTPHPKLWLFSLNENSQSGKEREWNQREGEVKMVIC